MANSRRRSRSIESLPILLVLLVILWNDISVARALHPLRLALLNHNRVTSSPCSSGGLASSLPLVGRNECSVLRVLDIRGGSDEEDEEDQEDDDEEEGEDEESKEDADSRSELEPSASIGMTSSTSVVQITKSLIVFVGKLTLRTAKLTSRVLLAAVSGDDALEEGDTEASTPPATLTGKVVRMLQRMWRAAWNDDQGKDKALSSKVSSSKTSSTKTSNPTESIMRSPKLDKAASRVLATDFGKYLSQSYEVEATRDELDSVQPILTGSLSDALAYARSKARLLVVLIPANKPKGKSNADFDAIKGFLSAEVATVAEKRARKSEETGSYILWSAKSGSAEAVAAAKRLKAATTNSKGQKRPILLVAYPQQVVDLRVGGMPKIVPRLLAQHHCSPPPSTEMMAAWLNALRKRHSKQFASMQLELREGQLYKDRVEGYYGSIQSDRERQERERKEREQRLLEEKAELERQEAILLRRKELLASLPYEPPQANSGVVTISLRFADGQSLQRRFTSDARVSSLFNWVDAVQGIERESITLTTMNGQKSFEWDANDESTLADVGFARMTGLRVTERKATAEAKSFSSSQ